LRACGTPRAGDDAKKIVRVRLEELARIVEEQAPDSANSPFAADHLKRLHEYFAWRQGPVAYDAWKQRELVRIQQTLQQTSCSA
jgi:hypothetical protein